MSFVFEGSIEGSKSIINRLLILKALHKNLKVSYLSKADDVLRMKKCLEDFKNGHDIFDVGSGGTTFRFFSLFLSKYPGLWKIQLSEQLYSRPQQDLVNILSQLGVQSNFSKDNKGYFFYLETKGWSSNTARVDFAKSSQFFSGLAMAASDVKDEFQIDLKNYDLSSGYDEITYELLKKLNLNIYKSNTLFKIQKTNFDSKDVYFEVGADWSSVVTLLSFAFSGSKITIKNIDLKSSEPDLKGLEMLERLGLDYKIRNFENSNLSEIQAQSSKFSLKETMFNFDKNPDLFPQFCILLGLRCRLYGLEAHLKYPYQLVYKESDRLGLMKQALMRMGLKIETDKSYLKIISFDKSLNSFNADKIVLDSKSDHRLVMCYELMKSFGMNLEYQDSNAVSKSFPSFFEIIGKKKLRTNFDKIFLIGHRGVGKTTLLKNFKNSDYKVFDLDEEVEKFESQDIASLFNKIGEKGFRKLEIKYLQQLLKTHQDQKFVIAIGAGFEFEKLDLAHEGYVLWVKRTTDHAGRVFFNRPRLTAMTSLLKEWHSIFDSREAKYENYCHGQFYIPEYLDSEDDILSRYLNFKTPDKGYVTLIPKENEDLCFLNNLNIELRTDLYSEERLLDIILKSSAKKIIVSIRSVIKDLNFFALAASYSSENKSIFFDWDIKYGLPDPKILKYLHIYSSHADQAHEELYRYKQLLVKLLAQNGVSFTNSNEFPHYKVCPFVRSYDDFFEIEKFLKLNLSSENYSFLPRSDFKNTFNFIRQFRSYKDLIGFYRFGRGSSEDQPFWWQWPTQKPSGFFAIIGGDVSHSYTPSFHYKYFKSKKIWPVTIQGMDNFLDHKNYFYQMELKCAAVTSPYKTKLFQSTNYIATVSSESDFEACNTWILEKDHSYNTDYIGMKKFFEKNLSLDLPKVVWGGGSLLNQLQNLLPDAYFYSGREGELRIPNTVELDKSSEVQLVWAGGSSAIDPVKFKIKKIVDLDYKQNSSARHFCALSGIEYVSGFEFFKEQALEQQKIWDEYEL